MTYRATRGGRAGRRLAQKEKEVRAEVHARTWEWLATHPPRAQLPIELGRWHKNFDLPRFQDRYEVDFCGMEQREDSNGNQRWVPRSSVVNVPVMDRSRARSLAHFGMYPSPVAEAVRMIAFRPVQMALEANQTRVYWYNWEPTQGVFGDAESDLYGAASKILAYLSRVSLFFRELPASACARGSHGPTFGEVVEWMDELSSAFNEWMGIARVRYVIPGRREEERPQEVERTQR